jgi:hypothetical protein
VRTLVLLGAILVTPAFAQEPVGCDKFKWTVDRERELLAHPSQINSGSELSQPIAAAAMVALVPLASANLPVPPSRAPKTPDTNAGFVRVSAIEKAGTYRVTLSHGAWIDVVQNGQILKSLAFSGVAGCDGIAKSVKFELAPASFIVELSGTTASSIVFVVTPD